MKELKALNANLQIVVAFRMLPEVVWKMPELGTFNLHASLLPNYRGAAPINWAIINGDTKTGVTTFFIDERLNFNKSTDYFSLAKSRLYKLLLNFIKYLAVFYEVTINNAVCMIVLFGCLSFSFF